MVAEHKYKQIASICYVGVAAEAIEPPHAPRNTSRASATTTALHPADQHPRARVSNYLPAAGGHRPPSTASSRAAATYGARAGRRRSPTGSWAFLPLNHRPPPLLHSSRGPRDPTGSAVPTDALRSPSTAGQPCISTREARRKSASRRRSPPPTTSTCSTATKSSSGDLKLTAACAGMLGTVPHHSQPPCCPYRGRNRKPFRAGGRGRPAGVGSGENAAERT